jgi:hypothetical protein
MYLIEDDFAEVTFDLPYPSSSVSDPTLVVSDRMLELAYTSDDLSFLARFRGVVPLRDDEFRVKAEFGSTVHLFGYPNDEALSCHPLYNRGLKPYSISLVRNSSWIKSTMIANRVHRGHRDEFYADRQHMIICFQDSTFECLFRTCKLIEPIERLVFGG